jgi:hypothetical protein
MVCFQTQNTNLGRFFLCLGIKKFKFYGHLEYITVIWPFDKLEAIWYILPRFGILNNEKSGNPGHRFCSCFPAFTHTRTRATCITYRSTHARTRAFQNQVHTQACGITFHVNARFVERHNLKILTSKCRH